MHIAHSPHAENSMFFDRSNYNQSPDERKRKKDSSFHGRDSDDSLARVNTPNKLCLVFVVAEWIHNVMQRQQ